MLQVDVETHLNTFQLAIQFSAKAGQTLVLLGESGSGKTTVLRLLAGLLQPERGRIMLDTIPYFDSTLRIALPPQARDIGYVFQDYLLFPHMTVFENVAFGLRAQRISSKAVRTHVFEALERVHLSGLEQRRPAQLSGGQQQRVAIARALALRPRLLLLDEPMAALDVQTRREVRQELRHLLQELQLVTVLVTHQYVEALLFGRQILVLDQGKVIQQGQQRDLLDYPRSSYVAELVGMNFFQGQLKRYEDPQTCVVELSTNADPLQVVATLKEQGGEQPALESEVFVIVDPGNVTLHQTPPSSSARNVFAGKISQILRVSPTPAPTSPEGGRVRISLQLTNTSTLLNAEISEASARHMELQEGQPIFASFKASEASAYI